MEEIKKEISSYWTGRSEDFARLREEELNSEMAELWLWELKKGLPEGEHLRILDVGTGGGFPGIPLAILFPECKFHLIDRIGKKIKVAANVAESIDLENVTFQHGSVEENKSEYDFVVSRAVMPLPDLLKLIRKNIKKEQRNALPNGLLCLKGGELQNELVTVKKTSIVFDLKDYFKEDYFDTKKVVYVQIVKK